MNYGGDAAEQIVRMSLEGMEVTVRIAGTGAKHLAVALAATLREEQKTKGKTSMTKLLKSGKQLTVFSIPERDLKKFTIEAKKYGVLFHVIPSKTEKDGNGVIDILAGAEDAPKINRVVERFRLATVDKEQIKHEIEKDRVERGVPASREEKEAQLIADVKNVNPQKAGMERRNLSGQNFGKQRRENGDSIKKPSVKKKLDDYRKAQNVAEKTPRSKARTGKER